MREIWLTAESCRLEDFLAVIAGEATPADYPLAAKIVDNVPIYEGEAVRAAALSEKSRREMMAEWASVMLDGPGIIVLRDAVDRPRRRRSH